MSKVRIAHFSDIHFALRPGPGQMNLNRWFSWANWTLSRCKKHNRAHLEQTINELLRTKPDIVVLTGDVAHTGLDTELEAASAMLEHISGRGIPVLILGGNHDIYDRPKQHMILFSQIQQRHCLGVTIDTDGICRFNGMTLLILEQWLSNPFYMARGQVDSELLSLVRKRLEEKDITRIHLAAGHFPIVDFAGRMLSFRKRLGKAGLLRDFLLRSGAELYLCGHCHAQFSMPLCDGCTQYCAGAITEAGVLRTFQFEEGRLVNIHTFCPKNV